MVDTRIHCTLLNITTQPWPMAVVAVAYIAGQTVVDTWGE